MNDYLILDVLFGVIVVLFAAIGLWRGLVKEVVVAAAIFTGAALASSWSLPWGNDLAELTDLRVDVSRMIVTGVALLGATLILGYGSGGLVREHEIGWGKRITGALIAGINGALLLHYALVGVDRFFTGESTREALDQSFVARMLLREFGWLLLGGAALIVLTMLVASLVLRRTADPVIMPYAEEALDSSGGSRGRPARLPRGADDGKFEPSAKGFNQQSARYAADAPSLQQTIAMPPVDTGRFAAEGGRAAPSQAASSSSPGNPFAGDEWIRRIPYVPVEPKPRHMPETDRRRTDTTADDRRSAPPKGNGHRSFNDGSPFSWMTYPSTGTSGPESSPSSTGSPLHCPRCFSGVGPDDEYCSNCGARVAQS